MGTHTAGARGSPRIQPAGVALLARLLVAVAILLQPWLVLSQPSAQSLLYDFYKSTSGWTSGCSGGWSTNTTPLCSGGSTTWAMVICSAGRVAQINLNGCGIRGTLPWQWSNLTNIQTLSLAFNSLSGTLPWQWSSLTNLQRLALPGNSLNGTLPPQWSSLTTMRYLELYSNSFSGTLPWQWSNLMFLRNLYLNSNSLSSTLPWQWSSLTNMQTLSLDSNSLNGTLPQEWRNLTNMQYLYLAFNSLSGSLPLQWGNLTSMQTLSVTKNSLSGTLPWQWSSLTNLQHLSLDSNSLNGTLPPQWSNMTNMQYLYLAFNSLSGSLPLQWSNLTSMQTLSVTRNSLSGTLPWQWSSLTNLQHLSLDSNFFNGTLPPQWSGLANIQRVALSSNSLSGTLPWQWSSLTNLQTLFLSINSLSGTLPWQWSSLTNILTLFLSSNSLSGTLPWQWSNLTNILTLSLSSDSLNGTLPLQWSKLTNMRNLELDSNFLNGTLPWQWSNLTNMRILSATRNALSGTLPPQWSSLTKMQTLSLDSNSLSGTLPSEWAALSSSLYCHVSDNCLYTANAAAWWLSGTYRSIGRQRTMGCIAHGAPRGASLSLTSARGESVSDTYSSGFHLSPTVSSLSVGSISAIAHTRTKCSFTHSSSATRSAYSLSFTASLAFRASATSDLLGTLPLTPLCDAPPFAVNSSLRFAQPNNESHCGEYLCPTASPSLIDGVGGVRLTVAYDAMMAAPSVLLLLAEDGIRHMWLSLLPSVWLGAVTLDAVADAAPSDGTVGVVVLRPNSGWPGLAVQPYAMQRLSLVVALRCRSANGTVVSHPTEMVLVVTPRSSPVAASVRAVVQISQGIAGGLGSGGGAETLIIGRLAMSLSMLSCDDALQGFGAGLGVVSVSGDLLAAVDTIVGNVVFVAGVAAAAVLAACVLYLCASSSCSLIACCREVFHLPLSLFPVFAATLPSTVMAIVAVLRDAPVHLGSAASGAYASIAVAAAVWGGVLVLVGSATRRMMFAGTLRLTGGAVLDAAAVAGCGSGAVVLTFRRAFQSSTEWVALQAADTTLFEGTTVLWFLPLDVCTTVAIAVASALPLSRSAALCVGAHAVNVAGCGVMLAVAAVRRPFATAFGMIHSIVTYVMVLALAVCGLVLVATSSGRAANYGDAHSILLVVNYLSGSAAVLSALKAAVDAAGIVAATRRRFLTLTASRTQPCVGEGMRLGDVVAGDKVGENDCHLMLTLPVSVGSVDASDIGALELEDTPCDDFLIDDPPPQLFPEEEVHDHRLSNRLEDLLDAYQNVDAKERHTQP